MFIDISEHTEYSIEKKKVSFSLNEALAQINSYNCQQI